MQEGHSYLHLIDGKTEAQRSQRSLFAQGHTACKWQLKPGGLAPKLVHETTVASCPSDLVRWCVCAHKRVCALELQQPCPGGGLWLTPLPDPPQETWLPQVLSDPSIFWGPVLGGAPPPRPPSTPPAPALPRLLRKGGGFHGYPSPSGDTPFFV